MSEHGWEPYSDHPSVPQHPTSSSAYYNMDMPAIQHDMHPSIVLSSESASYPKWNSPSYPPSTAVGSPYPQSWTGATHTAEPDYLMHSDFPSGFSQQSSHHHQQQHHQHHQHHHSDHSGPVSWGPPHAKEVDTDMRQPSEDFLFHPPPAVSQSLNLGFNEPLAADSLNYHPNPLTGEPFRASSPAPQPVPRKESSASSYSSSYRGSLAPPPPQHLMSGNAPGNAGSDDASLYAPYRAARSQSHSPYPPSGIPYATSMRSSPTGHQDRRRPSQRSARPRVHSAPLMDEQTAADLYAAAEHKRLRSASPNPATASPPEQLFVHEHFPGLKSGTVASAGQRKQIQKLSHWRRAGGRTVGSHLAPDKAARTKEMREKGSCWLCALQRDQCSPGEPCDRCQKRMNTPGADTSLGCIRTKLGDLTEFFLPGLLLSVHEKRVLQKFCQTNIQSWFKTTFTIQLECGRDLPPIQCEVSEFQPKTWDLVRHLQYVTDTHTGLCERQERSSLPLGMMQVEEREKTTHSSYLSTIVDTHFTTFAERCYEGESSDFQMRLLMLMGRLNDSLPSSSDEGKHLREVLRLVVVTYIMGHKLTLAEATKLETLSKLSSCMPEPDAYEEQCSPRMANRQLKYLFAQLMRKIQSDVLSKLQQALRSGNVKRWTAAFVAILGLGMVLEHTQRSIRLMTDSLVARDQMTPADADAQADRLCEAIDDWFDFIANLFKRKYTRSFNPLRTDETEKLGPQAMGFVKDVQTLSSEHYSYLSQIQQTGISAGHQARYTSRLVGRFLLSVRDYS